MAKAIIEYNGKKIQVEGTEAQIKEAAAKISGFKSRKAPNEIEQFAMLGPSSRGSVAAQKGASVKDLPSILFQTADGVVQDTVENTIKNPFKTATSGIIGASNSDKKNEGELPNFLQPKTKAGENFGNELGMISSLMIDAYIGGSASSKLANKAGSFLEKRADDIRNVDEKFLKDVVEKIKGKRKEVNKFYGKVLDSIEKHLPDYSVDFSGAFSDAVETVSALDDKLPLALKKIASEFDVFDSKIGIKKAKTLINSLEGKVTKAIKSGDIPKGSETHYLDFINDLKTSLTQGAENIATNAEVKSILGAANSRFSKVANDFTQLFGQLKGDGLENIAKDGFSGLLTEQAFRRLLGKESFKKLVQFGKKRSFNEFLTKRVPSATVGSGIGAGVGALVGGLIASRKNK